MFILHTSRLGRIISYFLPAVETGTAAGRACVTMWRKIEIKRNKNDFLFLVPHKINFEDLIFGSRLTYSPEEVSEKFKNTPNYRLNSNQIYKVLRLSTLNSIIIAPIAYFQ